ncbi:putative caspase-like protein [Bradyrhizobium sp. i1.4.4]
MEVGGENWLIPISAELRSDTDAESEAISLRSVSLQVSKARKLGLVILDACRNNPFAAKMKRSLSTRAVARGLAPTEPSDNVLIAYAARDGTTASDGEGRNSPFTTSLLRHIETPGLEISFLFRRVRDDVMAATRREQQPFVYGSLSKEEIYLKAPAVAAQAPAASNSGARSSRGRREVLAGCPDVDGGSSL